MRPALTALTASLDRAQSDGSAEVILHTTGPMLIARDLYERMGFVRAPELDFGPENFAVLGMRLALRQPDDTEAVER